MGSVGEVVGTGVSPGVGRGELHVDVDDALDAIEAGRPVVLIIEASSPSDVPAMVRAAAVVATVGDARSHTAIVANAAGVPAVVGVGAMIIDAGGVTIDGVAVPVGASVTVDGSRGTVGWGSP